MSEIEAVIFDWGGTLTPWRSVDSTAGWHAYSSAIYPGQVALCERLAKLAAQAEDAYWARARECASAFTIADILADAGLPWHVGAEAAFLDFWADATQTDPDVPSVFRSLRDRGLRLGVLSSTWWPSAWHENILRRDGVLHLLDGHVWSSDLAVTKPHPDAFAAAMAKVGVPEPARCVFVGDRPYDDISGAKAVGMRAVLVPHSDIPPHQQVPVDVEPDAVIQRLADLPEVLDTLR